MKLDALVLLVALATPLAAFADEAPARSTKLEKAVLFEYGQTYIRTETRKQLTAMARQWRDGVQIRVEGHAFARDEESSILLGQLRAERVRSWLVKHGVPAEAVVAVGHSRSEPGRYVDLVLESK
jgi:outer membrane protein OmpA-like peptidoglycan-associated protein